MGVRKEPVIDDLAVGHFHLDEVERARRAVDEGDVCLLRSGQLEGSETEDRGSVEDVVHDGRETADGAASVGDVGVIAVVGSCRGLHTGIFV